MRARSRPIGVAAPTSASGARASARRLAWALADGLEALAARVWPRRLHRHTPWLLLAPALLLVGVLAASLLVVGDASLRVVDPDTFEPAETWSWGNYRQLLDQSVFLIILGRTTLAAFTVTALTLALAFPYAWLMVRTRSAGLRKLLLASLFLPFFIGQVVRAYGWLVILGHEGIVNGALAVLGLEPLRLLYHLPAVIFGLVQYMLPFAVLMLAPALMAIPEELEMAAESLGAHWVRVFATVTLPLARPGLSAAALVVFTLTVTDYAIPVVLGGGTQDFVANAIYDAFFRLSDGGLGSAATVALVLFATTLAGVISAALGARHGARSAGRAR